MYKFSFIIGYQHRPDRIYNLRRVISWLRSFNEVEIILVEQDRVPRIDDLAWFADVKYVFVQSDMPYNRSWSLNVGLRHASTEYITFSDADLIMDPNDFAKAVNLLDEYDCVSPYDEVIDTLPTEMTWPLDKLSTIDRPGRGKTDNQKINLCGGMICFRRDSIWNIGAWPEEFFGWACEDNLLTHKTKTFLKWAELPAKVYHLYHNKANIDPVLYEHNFNYLKEFEELSRDEMIDYIRSRTSIGRKNKCQS